MGWEDEVLEGRPLFDLGSGVKYTKIVDKNGMWIGINVWHIHADTGRLCGGWVPFDVQSEYLNPGVSKWTVESFDPLTISPSVWNQPCDLHGFIKNGKWISV